MEERDPLLSETYRAADHPSPSRELDARILDAARQAALPAPRRRSAWLGWAVPISSAAVLVLGIALLFQIQREVPETLREAMPSPTARLDSAPPPVAGNPAGPATPPATTEDARKTADAGVASGAGRGGVKPAPARPEPGFSPAPRGQATGSDSAAHAPSGMIPEPRPFPAQAAPVPPAANRSGQDDLGTGRSAAPAAAPAREVAPAFSQGLSRLKAASPETAGPEQWLESVRRLLKEGRTDEARKSLEELRKRYPGYGLPEDLSGLLER